MDDVHNMMKSALSENVFPGGVLLAAKEGSIKFFDAYGLANIFSNTIMTLHTIFDLASLTKALGTALAIMKLMEKSLISLDQDIDTLIPEAGGTDKRNIKIEQLLAHTAGFPDYKPYYLQLLSIPAENRKADLRNFIIHESLIAFPGEMVLYSDLGFMMLEWIIERISGKRLDIFLNEEVYAPLGLENFFFADIAAGIPKGNFAATEVCPWRKMLLQGAVHDDNAYVSGGIQGHAGLFGSAGDIFILLSELLSVFYGQDNHRIFKKEILKMFFQPYKNTGRSLGFDRPAVSGSSSGNFFSENSIGHLGFTGTSFWMDIERSIIVILLTNRVHPCRNNIKIRSFRPKLHDAVMKNLI